MAEPTVPEQVHREAAVAFVEASEAGGDAFARICQMDPLFRAAVESAYRAGLSAAVGEARPVSGGQT